MSNPQNDFYYGRNHIEQPDDPIDYWLSQILGMHRSFWFPNLPENCVDLEKFKPEAEHLIAITKAANSRADNGRLAYRVAEFLGKTDNVVALSHERIEVCLKLLFYAAQLGQCADFEDAENRAKSGMKFAFEKHYFSQLGTGNFKKYELNPEVFEKSVVTSLVSTESITSEASEEIPESPFVPNLPRPIENFFQALRKLGNSASRKEIMDEMESDTADEKSKSVEPSKFWADYPAWKPHLERWVDHSKRGVYILRTVPLTTPTKPSKSSVEIQ